MSLLERRIRDRGYRMTRQRQVVLEELGKVDTHPRADQIYQMVRRRIPHVSFGTIYRNLKTLEELGLISEIQRGHTARYDGNASLHHHFICRKCDRIIDVDEASAPEIDIPALGRMGYQVEKFQLQIVGLCPACKTRTDK
jgi:Fur family ferric uptake transcriptional regulator